MSGDAAGGPGGGSDGAATVEPPDHPDRPDVEALLTAFADAFGGEPEGVWAAPGRVNLIGEHLDYNGGPVLPMALPQVTLVALRRREDGQVRLVSASDLGEEEARWSGRLADVGPGAPQGWAAYAAGVLWALAQAGPPLAGAAGGVEAAFSSTVPIGAGLSSSAALECAVAIAVAELAGLGTGDAGRAALVEACVHAENEVAGAPTGGMDQAASLRASAGHALLLHTDDSSAEQVPLALGDAGLVLLVMDTRASHSHAGGEYGQRRAACEEAARTLGVEHLASLASPASGPDETPGGAPDETPGGDDEADDAGPLGDDAAAAGDAEVLDRLDEAARPLVRHVLTETRRVHRVVALLRSGRTEDVGAIGPVLTASHASMRDDYRISCAELDTAVDAAVSAGALGARMTGGGFGGSAIALVAADGVDAVREAVRSAAERAGHPEPAFYLAAPSPAARRVR